MDYFAGVYCLGGPNNYSWGWIQDDYGNLIMPYWQISGFGMNVWEVEYYE